MSQTHRVVFIVALTICSCAAHPPRARARTIPPIAKAPISAAPNAITPSSCVDAVDAREAKKILDALFPTYLTSTTQCDRPRYEPVTWVEIDHLQAEDYLIGQFVPRIVRRTVTPNDEASTGDPDADLISYVIMIESCQQNTIGHVVDATFLRAELARPRAKPFSRNEEHPSSTGMPPCAAAPER